MYEMKEYPVEIRDLEMRYGRSAEPALRGVSLEVKPGEVFGYLGPNGAGKTTTLKILMGLIGQTVGRAAIFGIDASDSRARNRVGFLPEDPNFYEYLTARETLKFFAGLHGIKRRRGEKRIDRCLEDVGLTYAENRRVGGFSRGMRQRLGLAQAMINDPDLMLLDEPLSGLDPVGRAQIRDVILRQSAAGKTIVFSSHILPDVEAVCSRVAILSAGELAATGTIEEMLEESVDNMEIVLSGISSRTVEAVRKIADSVRTVRGRIIACSRSSSTAQEIMRLAIADGGTVENVTPNRGTLEQFFIKRVEARAT